MKNSIGSLLALVTMVAYSSASTNCTQPLEIRSGLKILVHKYLCNQEVDNADLQTEPEIFYDAPLRQDRNYTLFLLENNNNTGSYKIHWFLTDIIPINKSLTANKTIVEGYKPPMNSKNSHFTVLMYGHHNNFHPISPSHTEMDNFIPNTWAAPIPNITLENNATFLVTGRNTSHLHPSGVIHPHTTTQTHTSQTHPTHPTFESPKTTIRPQYVTEKVTEKQTEYHVYNSTNSSSTNHNSPSHSHKSRATNHVCSLTVMFIPLISLITKVIF
ncbi:unnamed protein product [Nezara viridula]|uniref:Uncharacterized protein n=1 Tax=Nezara viridula TaxID=85310 RepID=A0A9P0GXB0_NEZVI|nr:unnamed protein product [Nezara viridula]